MTTRFIRFDSSHAARPGRIARNLVIAGAVFGAGCKKDPPAAAAPAPVAAPKTEAPASADPKSTPADPSPAPTAPAPTAPAPTAAAPTEQAAPPAAEPVAADASVLATAPFLAAVPNNALMVVGFRAPAALFEAMDEPGVMAALGKPGQEYRDGIKALFGFSLLDPAAWTAAGLDLQAPVGWVIASESGLTLTYFGVTDPTLAAAAVKKMAADMVWSPGDPTESKVGEATAFTFSGGKFTILLHGKYAIAVAGEHGDILTRLTTLKPEDAMSAGPAVAAAKALGAGKDVGFWVRLSPMLGAINPQHPLILPTAFGLQDLTGGIDLDAGAIKMKGLITVADTSLLKRGVKSGPKNALLGALTEAPDFYVALHVDPAVMSDPTNYQAVTEGLDVSRDLERLKEATGLDLAALLKDHLTGDLAYSLTIPSDLAAADGAEPPIGVAFHAGVKDEAAVNTLLGTLADKGLLTRGDGAGTYAVAAAGALPAFSVTVAGGAVLVGGGPGFAPAGPSFTQTVPANPGIAAILGADDRLGSFAIDSQVIVASSRPKDAPAAPEALQPDESEAIKAKRAEIAAARAKAQVAAAAASAADSALASAVAKIVGAMALNARVVDGTIVIEGGQYYGAATVAAASKALAEAFTAGMSEIAKAQAASSTEQEAVSKLEAELDALRAPAAEAAPAAPTEAPAAPVEAPAAPPEVPAAPAAPDAPK
ncbi:MAG: hypothetical protein IV100_14885 [Myxococcales bacterium]|nr:hypothetical protein [Myxococcales bacterium]